jgi:glycosyltransferase involved in cell wall biosynthesis
MSATDIRWGMAIGRLGKGLLAALPGMAPLIRRRPDQSEDAVSAYQQWSQDWDTPDRDQRQWLLQGQAGRDLRLVVVLLCGKERDSQRSLRSLSRSDHQSWDLQLVPAREEADGGTIRASLSESMARRVCEAAGQAHGHEVAVVIRAGAILRPHALGCLLAAVAEGSDDCWLYYGDEDKINPHRGIHAPLFKPPFACGVNQARYLVGGVVGLDLRKTRGRECLARLQTGLDPRCGGIGRALPGDLRPAEGHRISHVLFHDRSRDTVLEQESSRLANLHPPEEAVAVSLVIVCETGRCQLLHPLIEQATGQRNIRLVDLTVVCDSLPAAVASQLARLSRAGRATTVIADSSQSWGGLANSGAAAAKGAVLVFLTSGDELLDRGLLARLARLASAPHAGLVAAHHDQDLACLLISTTGGSTAGTGHGAEGPDPKVETRRTWRRLNSVAWPLEQVAGAICAISHGQWLASGGFDAGHNRWQAQLKLSLEGTARGWRNGSCAVLTSTDSLPGWPHRPAEGLLAEAKAIRDGGRPSDNTMVWSRALARWQPWDLAVVPQQRSIWHIPKPQASTTILLLSCVLSRGYGVSVVISMHARHLRDLGYNVVVAGPADADDLSYEGCIRQVVDNEYEAAVLIEELQPLLTIVHTPPFFSVALLVGKQHRLLALDHGEPPADLFANARHRMRVQKTKRDALRQFNRVYAISMAVANEASWTVDGVIQLGNTHIQAWDQQLLKRRLRTRHKRNWLDKRVVLSVCRIHKKERSYKGIEHIYEISQWIHNNRLNPNSDMVFVIAGKGTNDDAAELASLGLEVICNIDDDELLSLYAASDAYISYSQWEGFNLGIAQALAMGLPVFASDIPAHHAFRITVSNNLRQTAEAILNTVTTTPENRRAVPMPWQTGLDQLSQAIADLSASDARPGTAVYESCRATSDPQVVSSERDSSQ